MGNNKCDCMVLNFWSCQNYGALLTCFGVKCLMEKCGKETKVINYFPQAVFRNRYHGSFTEKFAEKYLNLTDHVRTINDLRALCKYADIFVTGSDQIWNQEIARTHHQETTDGLYLLDFVPNTKKKLSYSASFGVDVFNGTDEEKDNFHHFLKRFDGISVRETSGVEIIRKEFGKTAFQAIDGAFHIPKGKLAELCGADKPAKEKYIGCFVLPYYTSSNWYKERVAAFSAETGLPLKTLPFSPSTPMSEWLTFLKNAELVVTDSYHATVMSIIFNTPFIQLANAETQSRFESLYSKLHLPDATMTAKSPKLDLKKFITGFDWATVNSAIQSEVEKAEAWVQSVLDVPKGYNCNDDIIDNLVIKSKLREQILEEKLNLLANRRSIYLNYYRYKLFSKISLSKNKRKHYQFKKNILQNKIRKLREMAAADSI